MAKGNGKAPAQEPLIPGLEDEAPVEDAAQEADARPDDVHAAAEADAANAEQTEATPATLEVRVQELGNTTEGCWLVREGGERVELSDAEWRKELAHLFRKETPTPRA